MSGGVDSSTCAWMLKRDGHQVVGVTLRFHESAHRDAQLVKAHDIADKLGIDYHVIDARDRFGELVKTRLGESAAAGAYPNPCSICTPELKIPLLFEQMERYGCEYVATGHYARVTSQEAGFGLLPYQLRSSLDRSKDQTYLLYRLSQEQLSKLMFPLAEIHKGVVRRTAMQAGLMPIVPVNDGQGEPCFFDGDTAADWLEGEGGLAAEQGDIVDLGSRKAIGTHDGLHRYEFGQRVKLADDSEEQQGEFGPVEHFVVAKDHEHNELLVGPRGFAAHEMCRLRDVAWTSIEPLEKKRSCRVRLAWDRKPIPAQIVRSGDEILVAFNEVAYNVVPGREAVLYSDDLVLGGGVLETM